MKSGSSLLTLGLSPGKKASINLELPDVKLRALYTFIKQLFIRGAEVIKAVRGWEEPPQRPSDMLRELSTVPEWINELKLSTYRRGVMHALALGKAYHPEMKP